MIRTVEKTYVYTKIALLIALAFGFLAGAPMALEPAVTHQAFGIATWTIASVAIFLIACERIVVVFSSTWAQMRGGETGLQVRYFINIVVALTVITMSIVALAIH